MDEEYIKYLSSKLNKKYVDKFKSLPEENQQRIKALHESAFFILDQIDSAVEEMVAQESAVTIKEIQGKIIKLNNVLKCLEYAMQWEWGFDRNESYHSWWFKPKNCICPKIDNREMLGFGKIVVQECPVHGYLTKEAMK